MASNPDFVQYIADQCAGAGEITVKKMFGDYGIYCDGMIFGLICDNCFYLKPTDAGRKLLRNVEMRPPYDGAKDYFFIEDVDDRDYMSEIVKATCKELAVQKPKRKKQTMNKMIAVCGINCEKCDAFVATKNNDQALREKTAKLWSELNKTTILPEHINCEGCRMDGAKTVFCNNLCEIRKCALSKNYETCADCPEMDHCPKVGEIHANNTEAKKNLIKH